jgi:oligopeptidase B
MPFDPSLAAPRARKEATRSIHHGVELVDDYAWLRAANWQEVMRDPQVLDASIREHLEAENAYVSVQMGGTEEMQKALMAEMRGRIREDDSSPPMRDGPFAYASRFAEGGEYPKFIRLPAGGGVETVILDGDAEAEGKEYFRFGGAGHSPDHRLMAWSFDDNGSERYVQLFRVIEAGTDLDDRLTDTAGGGVFSSDSKSFVYARVDDNHRPSRLYLHQIGNPQDQDRLLMEDDHPGFFLGCDKTQSGEWIVLSSNDHDSTQCWLVPAADPAASPLLVAPRADGFQYDIEESGGVLYILTNRDGAKDFKIVTAPVNAPQPENWTDLVGHKPGRLIIAQAAFARHHVRLEREGGLPRIVVRRIADGAEHEIAFGEEAYSLGLGGPYEFDTDWIRFSYSSLATPSQTFDYNMESRERKLVKVQEVPSGHDSAAYVTRRIMAPAEDGESVPVSLLYRRDTPIDGSAPCLLYGYGSYGISIPAAFNTDILSLVNRGFVYAIAHVRGGKDKGYAWYEDGKLRGKTNTFTDFLAAARFLSKEGYCAPGRIVAEGRSAGGMLMGAVVNMAPELFCGIIAGVPFVDVLNTMLDDTLPLTPPEWTEWGNPIESREFFDLLASYSPYDRIEAKAYPPVLALGGLTDPRVTYWEPAKWVAKLREHQTGAAPILLKTHMGAGHGGASGRFQRLEDSALSFAFAIKAAGLPLT